MIVPRSFRDLLFSLVFQDLASVVSFRRIALFNRVAKCVAGGTQLPAIGMNYSVSCLVHRVRVINNAVV